MKASLHPRYYVRRDIYELEQTRIFKRLWIFACFYSAVSCDKAYVARRIAGDSVLIINQQGIIKAFANQCPHRLMPLKANGFGQGRLICPYHGWVFADDGKVKTIPKEQLLYQFDSAERESLCLKEYAVEVIGGLIFVNLDPTPFPITEQFSKDIIERIQQISNHFDDVFIHQEIPAAYNWKLNFENVMDSEHIPYIHPESFLPLVNNQTKTKTSALSEAKGTFPKPSSELLDQSWFSETPMKVESWPWHELVDSFGPVGTYHNHFLFPNVNFISVGGLVFLVQEFEPLSEYETNVRFSLCAAKARPGCRIGALPAILRGHLNGEVEVLMEDVLLLERLYAAMTEFSPGATQGTYEHAIIGFGLAYMALMTDSKAKNEK